MSEYVQVKVQAFIEVTKQRAHEERSDDEATGKDV